MREIIAFKTTDGKIFEAKDDAGSHQYEIDVKCDLENVISQFYFPGLGAHELVDALFEVRHTLREVLDRESG